jgi:hypothetical protein
MDNGSLDDILNGDNAPIEAPAVEEAAPAVETSPRDEQGRFAPKVDNAAPETPEPQGAPTAPTVEPGHVPYAALRDERHKRQQLEARLAEIERAQTQQFQQPQEVPDQFEDPNGHSDWLIAQSAQRATTAAIQAFQDQMVYHSEQRARAKYQDFDQKLEAFAQLVQADPTLGRKLYEQPEPAEWAYEQAKTHLEVQRYGSIEGLIEARIAERLQTARPAQVVPPSISNQRNVGTRTGPAWSGPRPLSDLLAR